MVLIYTVTNSAEELDHLSLEPLTEFEDVFDTLWSEVDDKIF
jgi:hypothetical protein